MILSVPQLQYTVSPKIAILIFFPLFIYLFIYLFILRTQLSKNVHHFAFLISGKHTISFKNADSLVKDLVGISKLLRVLLPVVWSPLSRTLSPGLHWIRLSFSNWFPWQLYQTYRSSRTSIWRPQAISLVQPSYRQNNSCYKFWF